jgi:hypothetical protein
LAYRRDIVGILSGYLWDIQPFTVLFLASLKDARMVYGNYIWHFTGAWQISMN